MSGPHLIRGVRSNLYSSAEVDKDKVRVCKFIYPDSIVHEYFGALKCNGEVSIPTSFKNSCICIYLPDTSLNQTLIDYIPDKIVKFNVYIEIREDMQVTATRILLSSLQIK